MIAAWAVAAHNSTSSENKILPFFIVTLPSDVFWNVLRAHLLALPTPKEMVRMFFNFFLLAAFCILGPGSFVGQTRLRPKKIPWLNSYKNCTTQKSATHYRTTWYFLGKALCQEKYSIIFLRVLKELKRKIETKNELAFSGFLKGEFSPKWCYFLGGWIFPHPKRGYKTTGWQADLGVVDGGEDVAVMTG